MKDGRLPRRAAAVLCLTLSACVGMAQTTMPPDSVADRSRSPAVRLSFFLDADLDGTRDSDEAALRGLSVEASVPLTRETDGSLLVPAGHALDLRVMGTSPSGKPLVLATLGEPRACLILPGLDLPALDGDLDVGLADGFLCSPLEPRTMNLADYASVLRDPGAWMRQCDPLYPEGWPYERSYFFYGYRIPSGPLEGEPHLAFDLWALPGTPVLAAAPGTVVAGLYDWRFGIEGPFGVVYYNHLDPAVKVGDRVERCQVVGWIAEGQGNHLHFELRPEPERILEAFPGMGAADMLKSPARGEAVGLPAWFGGSVPLRIEAPSP